MKQQTLEAPHVAEEGRHGIDDLAAARAKTHCRIEADEAERWPRRLDKVKRRLLGQRFRIDRAVSRVRRARRTIE